MIAYIRLYLFVPKVIGKGKGPKYLYFRFRNLWLAHKDVVSLKYIACILSGALHFNFI